MRNQVQYEGGGCVLHSQDPFLFGMVTSWSCCAQQRRGPFTHSRSTNFPPVTGRYCVARSREHSLVPDNWERVAFRAAGGTVLLRTTGALLHSTVRFTTGGFFSEVFGTAGTLRRSWSFSSYIPPQYSISNFTHIKISSAVVDCVRFSSTAEILCSPIRAEYIITVRKIFDRVKKQVTSWYKPET